MWLEHRRRGETITRPSSIVATDVEETSSGLTLQQLAASRGAAIAAYTRDGPVPFHVREARPRTAVREASMMARAQRFMALGLAVAASTACFDAEDDLESTSSQLGGGGGGGGGSSVGLALEVDDGDGVP